MVSVPWFALLKFFKNYGGMGFPFHLTTHDTKNCQHVPHPIFQELVSTQRFPGEKV